MLDDEVIEAGDPSEDRRMSLLAPSVSYKRADAHLKIDQGFLVNPVQRETSLCLCKYNNLRVIVDLHTGQVSYIIINYIDR